MRAVAASATDWLMLVTPSEERKIHGQFGSNYQLTRNVDAHMVPVEQSDAAQAAQGGVIYGDLTTCTACRGALTKLASTQHLKETGDRVGATSILAMKPPRASILPNWLAQRANAESKAVHQRQQRTGRGKGRGKGDSKDGKKK